MTPASSSTRTNGDEAAALIRDFIATFDGSVSVERSARMLERLHGEQYRHEREHYPEWVDHGGEA